jgi:hypothetical protein
VKQQNNVTRWSILQKRKKKENVDDQTAMTTRKMRNEK